MKLLLKLHWIFLSNHIWIEFWKPYLPTTVTYLFTQIGIQKLEEHHRFPAKIQELPGQISKERLSHVIPQSLCYSTDSGIYDGSMFLLYECLFCNISAQVPNCAHSVSMANADAGVLREIHCSCAVRVCVYSLYRKSLRAAYFITYNLG